MENVEQQRDQDHHCGIQGVRVDLMCHEVSLAALYILDQSKNRADDNDKTCAVENEYVSLPR